jgi:hypothetical protein
MKKSEEYDQEGAKLHNEVWDPIMEIIEETLVEQEKEAKKKQAILDKKQEDVRKKKAE